MSETRRFTRAQVATHNHSGDAAIIIDNVVYDVTGFLDDHPGGAEMLMLNAGKDATQYFRDIEHSDLAYTLREQYVAGEVVDEEKWPVEPRHKPLDSSREPLTLSDLLEVAFSPVALAVFSFLVCLYLFG